VLVILFYLIFCIAVGFIASQRGRSGLLSVLISPILAVIIVALIPSRSPSATSLESQVRDRLLEDRFAQSIRAHKPAFSNSLVYDVEIGREKRRFRSKADAIAFCMSRAHPDAPQLPQQL